jgi:hypothetical protein
VDINNIGDILGDAGTGGFIYSRGVYTPISYPTGAGADIQSINDLGQIAGYYLDSIGGSEIPFLADPAPPLPTSIQQEIAGLYAAVYNRAADALGMNYWVNVVAQQPDAQSVTMASAANTPISASDAQLLGQLFVSTQSAYFDQAYSSLNDADFVNALYFNLGAQHAETQSAVGYWVNVIQQTEASGASVQQARGMMVGQFVHDLIDVDQFLGNPHLRPVS